MRWSGRGTLWERLEMCTDVLGEPEDKKQLGKPRRTVNVRIILKSTFKKNRMGGSGLFLFMSW
jgi:hypothetical protein